MGAIVIMACRSLEKAKIARDAILNEVNCDPSQLIILPLDLNSFSSVRSFVSDFEKLKLPLHCLINNAGLMMSERSETPEGFEMVMTANHLSAFLLTSLLIPALEAGAKKFKVYSRVVNVSSSLHQIPKKFDFHDIMSEKRFELFYTYGQSKLANILFTLELQRRLVKSGSHITANCLHPGFVRTEVTRHMNAFLYWGDKLATPIMLTLQKTPPQGAYCTLHVATSPELEQKGGLYFINCDAAKPSAAANDIDARRLWEVSNTLTKADFHL
jgi:retinol dehydrogenase-13